MDRLASMEVFVRVVETGSFSGAAERLGLSRAAASKQVMQLEERLGTRLLNRTTRRLSLTEDGQAFYERSLRILAEMEAAEAEAADRHGEPRGTLRLSAPVSFGLLHLGGALSGFLERHPAVAVTVTLDDRYVDLVEEGFDAAIRIGRLADSSLVARRVCAVELLLVASPDYWRRHGKPGSPAELAGHPALLYTLAAFGREWRLADRAGREETVLAKPVLAANNGDVLRAAALAGTGVALLPDFIVGQDVREGRLEEAVPGWRGPQGGIHIVWPSSRHVAIKLRAFIDHLVAHFAERPSWAAELGQDSDLVSKSARLR
jgi:DNA-binding transcriptional LysR family regulator